VPFWKATSQQILSKRQIEKELELRITVVGDAIFSVAIHTQENDQARTDWRLLGIDISRLEHSVHPLPAHVEEGIRRTMVDLNLVYGCIDMILTPEGEYIFLEVNPYG